MTPVVVMRLWLPRSSALIAVFKGCAVFVGWAFDVIWLKAVVVDGVEAMAFLRRPGQYRKAIPPHVIRLDLNLPRKDGRQVLAEIKEDPDLHAIPAIVLITSSAEEDLRESCRLHANAFVTKLSDYIDLSRVVRAIAEFWLGVVPLPREARASW
jgi:two-component system, chemotaxis family, response regulator Rcp1